MYWEVLRPCLVMECKSLDVYSLKEQNTTLSTGRRGTAGVKRIRRVSSSTIEDGRSSGNVLHLASSCDNSPTSLVGFASIQKHSRQSSKQAWSSGHDLMEDNLVSTKKNLSLREHPLPGYLNGAVDGVFGRAEDHIGLDDLAKLRHKFEEVDRHGDGTLDKDEFLDVCDQLFGLGGKNEEEMITFFHKIDYNSMGYINWDEFCTYMYLELHERDDAQNRARKVEFHCPAHIPCNPHKDSLCRVANLTDGSLISCSQDGVVCLWTHDLEPKRIRKTEAGQLGKPKWVTDMALCIPQSKILLVTGEHELQFYEMINFEPYCQLKRLESVPLKVNFWSNPQKPNECIILVGDKEGTLTVMVAPNIQEAFKYWKLGPKNTEGMPTYPLDRLATDMLGGVRLYRWRLHSNWVSEVHYFAELRCFASCSCDSVSSLVLGSPTGSTQVETLLRPLTAHQSSLVSHSSAGRSRSAYPAKHRLPGDQRVFCVPKGISTMDYCPKNNVIVTGSMDQIIRIWNPFITCKPTATLPCHGSPVFSVRVDSTNNRIYSIGNDNTVKVWDIVELNRLCAVIPSAHKVFTAVEAAHFNPVHQVLVLATDQLAVLKLVSSSGLGKSGVWSHAHPISGLRYSKCFNQIVTACEGSVVKVWDVFRGECVFEFSTASGDGTISAIDIDHLGRRLVTGGQNGNIQLWNYNNGHCIRTLDKGNAKEVTDVKFISVKQNRYIVAVGWDRKINLFPDISGSISHVQKPIEAWSAATDDVHMNDILSVAFGAPHLMATSSFDGEIVVWSVISCHILCQLKAPPTSSSSFNSQLQGDQAVQKLLFLDRRSKIRTAASLVASGPAGYIHFWNVYDPSKPFGCFLASQFGSVTAMTVDTSNSVLFCGDLMGFLSLWSIKTYCTTVAQPISSPKRIAAWRAHSHKVTCIELVEDWNALVTGSADCTVRLWTLEGQYIGTFGQSERWTVGDPMTYQHPLALEDVVFDSMPEGDQEQEYPEENKQHVQLQERQNTILEVTKVESDEEEDVESLLQSHVSMCLPGLDHDSAEKVGKRLRHLRTNSAKPTSASTFGVYNSLPYQPLSDEPLFTLAHHTVQTGTTG